MEVLWDGYGIPQVWATSPRDALFAQGWLHARHRLWQVELFRRVAAGRLSELFGPTTVQTDRFLRTLGMDRAAAAGVALLEDGERELLEGYAAGLNAAVQGWSGLLPPEFLILGIEPEPYTLEDVLALEKIMAFDLSQYTQAVGLARLVAAVGPDSAAALQVGYPGWGTTILGSAGLEEAPERLYNPGEGDAAGPGVPVAGSGSPVAGPGAAPVAGVGSPPVEDTRRAAGDGSRRAVAPIRMTSSPRPPALPSPGVPDRLALLDRVLMPSARGPFDFAAAANVLRGSNSWVVGPDRSGSGHPLLANDMHLALNRPAIWYLMGLHAPGMDVVGMSLPGTAGIVAGRTAGVAWGFTNAQVDDMELFVERVVPGEGARYETPGGSELFEERTEIIEIRGGGADTLVVRSTRHGPVLTPVVDLPADEVLALRWVAHDPSRTPAALLGMNRAGSADEFLAALADFGDPHQNVVFADTAGRWGYWMAGRIPDRPGGPPPLGPVPGWSGAYDWRGYLPFEDHPHALAPPSGFIVTANNRQTRDAVGARINATGWAPPWRAMRIAELLDGRATHDVASLHDIQLDVVTLRGRRFAAAAARAFRAEGAEAQAALLEAWDGTAHLDSEAAALFSAWMDSVNDGVARTVVEDRGASVPYGVTLSVLLDGDTVPSAVERAAARALAHGEPVPLRQVQTLRLDHPLSAVGVLQALFGFSREDIPVPGSPVTVNPASGRGGEGTHVRWGASQRHVSDLSDLDAGGFVLPGGQSGWPGGRHALDQLPPWREGGLIPLPMSREGAEARARTRLMLRP